MEIKFLDEAKKELVNIYTRIKQVNPNSAVKIYNNILDEIDRLSIFPNLGKLHNSTLRILIVLRQYYVVYLVEAKSETVYIVLIWECRRNPEVLKKRILDALG